MSIQSRIRDIEGRLRIGEHTALIHMAYYKGDILKFVSDYTLPCDHACEMTLIRGADFGETYENTQQSIR